MKKLLFSLAAMLMASSAFAGHWVTFNAEDFDYTSGDIFIENDDVTIQGYGRVDYDHFRFYANHSIAFYHDDGILKIEFTCVGEDDSQYGPGNFEYESGQRGYYSYEGYIGLWEDGFFDHVTGTFTAFEDEYFSDDAAVNPMQVVELNADYQVRCTSIRVYVLDDGEDPIVEPTEQTAAPTFNGYTTDGIHAYFVEIIPTEPSTIYYRIQFPDGTWSDWEVYTNILSFEGDGKYRVEAYAVADGKLQSEQIAYEFVVAPMTGITEMVEGKQVAGVRYFNMAGQEMSEANGLTIMVTTYTDGTTSAAKVMK